MVTEPADGAWCKHVFDRVMLCWSLEKDVDQQCMVGSRASAMVPPSWRLIFSHLKLLFLAINIIVIPTGMNITYCNKFCFNFDSWLHQLILGKRIIIRCGMLILRQRNYIIALSAVIVKIKNWLIRFRAPSLVKYHETEFGSVYCVIIWKWHVAMLPPDFKLAVIE